MFEATYKYIYVLWQRFRRQIAHSRVGVSKGGNNGRAMHVGLRMMSGIPFGWRCWRACF